MANFYDDNDDLRWYISTGIDWEPIVRLTEYDYQAEDGFTEPTEAVAFYDDVLRLIGSYAAESIAPRWKELDAAHPHLTADGGVCELPVVGEIMDGLHQLGVPAMCLPRELGGMGCPLILLQAQNELLCRADVSIGAHLGFHGGIALAALMYSIMEGSTTFQQDPPAIEDTRFRVCIEQIAAGEAWGSMDITEPQAGSDMAGLQTRGEQDEDGRWFVTGQKIFITSGHGRWHFVIARTEESDSEDAFAGLKGLSMFLVEAFDDDGVRSTVQVSGVEEKLGHNASATCTVSFDRAPGELIGARGEGFKYMLVLMNNARVGVGFESIGLMEAADRAARAYASERRSMGKTIDQHEMIAEMLEEMQTERQACRALAMAAAWHEELSQKLQIALTHLPLEEGRAAELAADKKRHAKQSRFLTPLLKWYAAERAVAHAKNAVQIHGGSGYIRESGVEKLLRDAMVFPIYEGTTQIQALMVMKDNLLGVVRDPAAFVRKTTQLRWRSLSARDSLERRVASLSLAAQQSIQFLVSRLAAAKLKELRHIGPSEWSSVFQNWDPKRDFALAMLHADRLTSMLLDGAVAELLLEQQKKDAGRRDLLVRWLEAAEPRSRYSADRISRTGSRLLKKLAENTAATAPDRQAAK
ncbi:MAG: alkylation response protein AidB-like acyl-CoA dehydrogenase [Myxococcota bacterium]